jgi:spermidine/putrescine transport system ATP-binding protein
MNDRPAEEEEGATGATAAIELVGIEKTFKSGRELFAAVRGVDLTIRGGEFFSLLGPSGCGKTTTLRIIAGSEQPTRGVVRLYGKDVTAAGPDKRDVNLVFQNYALFPHLNVYDNIAFGLRRRGVPKPELKTRVADIIEIVQLGGFERRMPKQLSGGQQQRVALGRALVNRPRALLLDEPLGALDLKLRQSMQIELKRIQRDMGITFIYVTHDQSEALTMSDRLAVMRNGRIEQLGAPREVYDEPATAFVMERVVVPAPGPIALGSELSFTVRPEKITLDTEMPERPSRVRGRVSEVIFLGTSTTYIVSTRLAGEVLVFQQNSESVRHPDRGDDVWLSWLEENARPFATHEEGTNE